MNYSMPSMKWFTAMRILVPLGLLATLATGYSTYLQLKLQDVFLFYPSYKTILIIEIALNVIVLGALFYCLMTYNYLAVPLCYAIIGIVVLLSVIYAVYFMSVDLWDDSVTTTIIISITRTCAFYIPSSIYLKKRLKNPFSGEKMRSKADWNSFVLDVQNKNTPEMV